MIFAQFLIHSYLEFEHFWGWDWVEDGSGLGGLKGVSQRDSW